MIRPFREAFALLAVSCLITAPARAQSALISEVRLGVLAHDVPILGLQREHGLDLNGEVLFVSPVAATAIAGIGPAWQWLFQPRPNLGVDYNTAGQTSQAYAGLSWTPWQRPEVFGLPGTAFLEISFGGSVNDGRIYSPDNSRLDLGANLLFRESIELGYRFAEGTSVSLFFEHSSNAGLGSYNYGLNNLGLRVGHRF